MIINNRNCNIFTFDLKNNNYYYIETGHLYNFNGMKSYVSDQQLTVTVICRISIESRDRDYCSHSIEWHSHYAAKLTAGNWTAELSAGHFQVLHLQRWCEFFAWIHIVKCNPGFYLWFNMVVVSKYQEVLPSPFPSIPLTPVSSPQPLSFPSLPLPIGPSNLARWSGELPQLGLGRSPSRNRMWCILSWKSDIW